MPDVKAFRALRFTPKAGAIEDLVAPPYDVIGADERDRLASRSPYNCVRLTLPGGEAEGEGEGSLPETRYERAARLIDRWLDSGALEVERKPSMTVVQEVFTSDDREYARTGVEVALELAAYGEGDVYPHERTLEAPKADRLALMRATRSQLGPVFMLVPDEDGALRKAVAEASSGEPDDEINGPDAARRRVWFASDGGKLRAIEGATKGRPAVIADGHHRYETALAYRDEVASLTGDPGEAAYVLAHIVPIGDPGLVVLPTHRTVRPKAALAPEELLSKLGRSFDLEEVSREEAVGFARRPARKGEPKGFVLAAGDPVRLHRASLRDPALMKRRAPDRAGAWRALDVPCLHLLVLEDVLGITPDEVASGGYVSYSHDAVAIIAAVGCEGALGFILRPTPPDAVSAVARAGEKMPQKSTYFYPKVAAGFAMRLLS